MKQFLTALLALVLFPAFLTAGSANPAADKLAYVSEVKLIGGSSDQVGQLKASSQNQGWTVIESNLNAGTRGDVIYLCYKTTNDASKAITDLYLSSGSNPVARSLTIKGRSYSLCPCEGGKHFTEIRGDLNSNCGGDDIHLFYTKDGFGDGRAVTNIWFNATQKGAVCKDGTSTPYDLNKGAGGDDIFLHFASTASTSSSSSSRKDVTCISEVKLIGGNADEIRQLKASSQNQGWKVIESNLNAGTRGDIIYLCYKTSNDGSKAITDLYLSSASNPVSGTQNFKGRTYSLCPCEGGKHFRDIRGDLNSNCGGDDIHLFYTKDGFGDGRVVTEIWFNASQKGAVCKDGTSTPYDLNKGAGGDDIFLHFSTK